jgi:peroxiredoxin Q/BCP
VARILRQNDNCPRYHDRMKIALLLILPLLAWIGWRAWHTGPLPESGTHAPDFRLPDQYGKQHGLSDYAGRWLVLFFYPKDDTPGCTREACAFRDGLAKLQAAGAVVVGVSVDTQASHRKFADKYQLPFTLLADTDGAVARRYGALMDWQVVRMARRMTFLITPAGRLHRIYQHVDPTRHAGEILAELTKSA